MTHVDETRERFRKAREAREKTDKKRQSTQDWIDNLTGLRLVWIGIKCCMASIVATLAVGLCLGVPVWLLYKLFFVVLP